MHITRKVFQMEKNVIIAVDLVNDKTIVATSKEAISVFLGISTTTIWRLLKSGPYYRCDKYIISCHTEIVKQKKGNGKQLREYNREMREVKRVYKESQDRFN